MGRKQAREKVMHTLFQMDVHNEFSKEFLKKDNDSTTVDNKENSYIEDIISLFIDHKKDIDKVIEQNSKEWKINRIAKVDLAILRVAITEIYYMDDIPNSVSINEAVELAKTFSTEESGSFINGVLGNALKGN